MARYSGPGFVSYQGRPVLQAKSVDVQIQSGNNDVDTLILGRAGHSKGSKKVQIQVDNAIPQAGPEIDWEGLAEAQEEIPLSFTVAGKTRNCVGDIRDVTVKSSTDAANIISYTFHGRTVSRV